nr:hypothetical protein [Tanacetum cinerariifolium]
MLYGLLRYAKSKPNRKLLVNSIKNGPYVRRIIYEPDDSNSVQPIAEYTHEQTNDKLAYQEAKQMKADDQAIQSILMGLPKDIYAAVDSGQIAKEIWLRVEHMMKGSTIGAQEKKAKLFNEWEKFKSTEGEIIESYYHRLLKLMNDFSRENIFHKRLPAISIRPTRRDAAYLQTRLLIAQKEEAWIQLQAKDFDLMAAVEDIDEIKDVNADCVLMDNLQQASTLGIQIGKASVYDSDGTYEVSDSYSCYDNENDSNVILDASGMEQSEGTIDQNHVTVEEIRMFMINHFKTSREEKPVPNKPLRASVRTKPITVSQPSITHKKTMNSNSNGSSSIRVDNTAKTRRPQPRRNTKNDGVPSASKSNGIKNKEVDVEEHHMNLVHSKNKRHLSSECKNIKLAIQNDKFEVVCAMSGSESRPPMLNKENYVPWSSRLLRDANRKVTVTETFHVQTDDELTDKELKQIEADDQAIQTIFLGLPEDIYAAVYSCETAQEIWLRFQQMMKGSDIGIQEKKAKMFNEWESHNGVDMLLLFIRPRTCIQLITLNSPHQDQSSFNQNYMKQPMSNPEDITDPTNAMNMALALMAKLKQCCKTRSTRPINHRLDATRPPTLPINVTGSNKLVNCGQQRSTMVNDGQTCRKPSNLAERNGNQNQTGNGNLVAARAEGNAAGQNGNQIRCYNCRGVGHYARNCSVMPRRKDAAYLQTQLLIAQKEEAGIQLQAEEYDLMAAAADIDEIEEVNEKSILMANLQQASTSDTQTDSASVYDSDGSAEVHENCDDNEIFNMFTQEEQYTEILEPIPESHQVLQNDNDVISKDTSVEQGRETVEQHLANFKETRALYESLY